MPSQNACTWVFSIDVAGACNGWTPDEKLWNAQTTLSGRAAYWLDNEEYTTWHQFAEAFVHAFPPDVETALLAALSVKQGWYEHPQEYLVRILVTVEQCDKYGLDISSLLLMLFLNGLCDHIKHRAMNRLPGSLVDAVKHADYNGHMYRWQVPEAAERAGATASGDMQYEDADLRSFKCSKPKKPRSSHHADKDARSVLAIFSTQALQARIHDLTNLAATYTE